MEYRSTREWPYHVSCGGVVYRLADGRLEFVLLYRSARRREGRETWHLPKGTLHSHETLEQCALREIREESGLDVAIEAYLGALSGSWNDSTTGRFIDKTTHYFLCRYVADHPDGMDREHDRVDWETAEEALRKLDRVPKREGEIIRRAERFLSLSGTRPNPRNPNRKVENGDG